MFDIKKEDCVGQTNKLLFNIWQELKKTESKAVKQEPKPCQYCGKTHDNVGQRLACAKKNKKKE